MIRGFTPAQRPALIVNECQKGIVEPGEAMFPGLAEQAKARGIVPKIAKLAAAFRRAGLPVFHTPVIHRADLAGVMPNTLINALSLKKGSMKVGSPESDYADALRPEPSDFIIDRPSGLIAFAGTTLESTLRRLGVTTIVLTGVSTNVAMPGNAFAAVEAGFNVLIPEDCIAGADAATHEVIVREQLRMLATITSAADLISELEVWPVPAH
jgi:nicotinamidase-related amidase